MTRYHQLRTNYEDFTNQLVKRLCALKCKLAHILNQNPEEGDVSKYIVLSKR